LEGENRAGPCKKGGKKPLWLLSQLEGGKEGFTRWKVKKNVPRNLAYKEGKKKISCLTTKRKGFRASQGKVRCDTSGKSGGEKTSLLCDVEEKNTFQPGRKDEQEGASPCGHQKRTSLLNPKAFLRLLVKGEKEGRRATNSSVNKRELTSS